MADSIKIYTNFTNYKNYNERIKSFINFFMSFSNVYLHLTSKSETALFKSISLSDASVEYNTENNSISITPSEMSISEYIKVKLINCALIQTSIEETDEDPVESEPIVIDGIYTLSDGIIVINGTDSIVPPDEGKQYVLSNPENAKCVLIPDSNLSVSIQSPDSMVAEKFAILLNNSSTATMSDTGKYMCDTTFTTHDTSLSLYKFDHGSTTVVKDTNFSDLQCKVIPYVNGEVNTDTSYIPYDAILTENVINELETPTHTIESVVEIEDNDEFSFNLRTTSFYVKSNSDETKFYDVYYKMFIASNLDDDRVTNIITQQGINCVSGDMMLMMIPNFSAEFGFVLTGLVNISFTDGNSLSTVKSVPIYLFNLTNVKDIVNTPYAACVMLCDSETGNPITDISDFNFERLYITNNTETDPVNEFMIGIRNHSIDSGHIDSIDPEEIMSILQIGG